MARPAPALLFSLVCCLFAVTAPSRADLAPASAPLTITEQAKLAASDGEPSDDFGFSVAVSGDTAAVGAFRDDTSTGSAYLFIRNGSSWSEQIKLPGTYGSFFGASVAISGDTVVIGAPGEGRGSAYVFVRDGPGWSLQAKLTPGDASPLAAFGRTVAIDGDTVIVGTPNDWIGDQVDRGSAFIFVRSGSSWSEQAKLMASDGAQADLFGLAVAISGGTAAVGALGRQGFRGAAYLFVRNGSSWSEQAQLLAPGAQEFDGFGSSIAISGDTVAVGAPGAKGPGDEGNTGAAYVFRRTGSSWLQQARLLTSDARENSSFGRSLALSGDTLAVGAFGDAAYVFVRGLAAWYERAKLLPSDLGGTSNSLGDGIALSGNTVIVGARNIANPQTGQGVGASYIFSLSLPPGFTVSPGGGLLTTEWGGTAQFFVVLNSQPAGDVVIDLASSDPGEGSVSPAQLSFTPQSWPGPQTVTLTGANDFVQDGNQPYSAVLSMNTALTTDPAYAQIDPPDVSAVNLGLEGDFYTISPCRVLDTRLPEQGPILASGVKRLVQIHGVCGIPATAGAVALNVTIVRPTGSGTLTLFPGDLAPPGLSSLTFQSGQILAGNAIVLLATDNTGTLAAWLSLGGGGSSHVVIDVSGYFE